MNVHDMFRSLFGLHRDEHFDNRDRDNLPVDEDDEHDDVEQPGVDEIGDMFHHFHGDLERQMEEMQRQMQDMFKNFGRIEFPALTPSHESDDEGPADTLRDRMLKPPTAVDPSPDHKHFSFGAIVPSVPRWNRRASQPKLDSDLDETVKKGDDLKKLFDPRERHPGDTPADRLPDRKLPKSSFRSVSISTIHKPDGSLVQKHTTRDSEGTEETTVTRSVGDKVHTETTKTASSGKQTYQETYTNIEEKDKSLFENIWRHSSSPSRSPVHDAFLKDNPSLPSTKQEDTQLKESMFHKFFGFAWPATSRKDL